MRSIYRVVGMSQLPEDKFRRILNITLPFLNVIAHYTFFLNIDNKLFVSPTPWFKNENSCQRLRVRNTEAILGG